MTEAAHIEHSGDNERDSQAAFTELVRSVLLYYAPGEDGADLPLDPDNPEFSRTLAWLQLSGAKAGPAPLGKDVFVGYGHDKLGIRSLILPATVSEVSLVFFGGPEPWFGFALMYEQGLPDGSDLLFGQTIGLRLTQAEGMTFFRVLQCSRLTDDSTEHLCGEYKSAPVGPVIVSNYCGLAQTGLRLVKR